MAHMPKVILFVLLAVVAAVCMAAALEADLPVPAELGGDFFFCESDIVFNFVNCLPNIQPLP